MSISDIWWLHNHTYIGLASYLSLFSDTEKLQLQPRTSDSHYTGYLPSTELWWNSVEGRNCTNFIVLLVQKM